jgi:hypothetical protein
MNKTKFAYVFFSSLFLVTHAIGNERPKTVDSKLVAARSAEESKDDNSESAASDTLPESRASIPDAAEATKHQGFERKAVSLIGSRKINAILSNPYIPQALVRREHVNPEVGQRSPTLQTGLFWQIKNMTCEEDNSLLVDAYTSNEQGERQQGTWRIAENGAISAANVQSLGDKRSGVRKSKANRFKDGSKFVANFPEKETVEGKVNGIETEIQLSRRIYDATRDEMILATERYSGEGHPFYGSIFSLWRQGNNTEARRLISWSPLGKDISKYGYSFDLRHFYANPISSMVVDKDGRIFLSINVDLHAGVAVNSANRLHRNVIYRLDEANKKMIPIVDTDLDKLYNSGKQADDPGFSERILKGRGYYADGPLNKAFIGDVPVRRICFDQNNHLFVLDSSPASAMNSVIRKIDFEKNEITTWAY